MDTLKWAYNSSDLSSDFRLLRVMGRYSEVVLRVPDNERVWRWRYDRRSYPIKGLISSLTRSMSEVISLGEDYEL